MPQARGSCPGSGEDFLEEGLILAPILVVSAGVDFALSEVWFPRGFGRGRSGRVGKGDV